MSRRSFVKGVLSPHDARQCLEAGVAGIVLSHHGGRVACSIPPLLALEQIADVVKGKMKIFIDCGIVSGMDAYKCPGSASPASTNQKKTG